MPLNWWVALAGPLVSAQKLSWFCRSKQNDFLLTMVNMNNGKVWVRVKVTMQILQSAIKIISSILWLRVCLHCSHEWVFIEHPPSSNKVGAVQCNLAGSSGMGRVVQSLLKSTGNQFTSYYEQTHFSVPQDICLSFGCLCYSRCQSPSWKWDTGS